MALIEFVDGVTKGNAETFNHNFNEVKELKEEINKLKESEK